MATVSVPMFREAFPTQAGGPALYLPPNSTTTGVVTNIVVVNTKDTSERFTISLDGVELFSNTPISANATISIDMKQVILDGITGFASSNLVKAHISGVEIS